MEDMCDIPTFKRRIHLAEDRAKTAEHTIAEIQARIDAAVDVITLVEARCMATDGPVTPTLQEITEIEFREVYQLIVGEKEVPKQNALSLAQAENKRLMIWTNAQQDQLVNAQTEIARLQGTLRDIGQSGPVNDKGEQDAYAGWEWCYDRANETLNASQGTTADGENVEDITDTWEF